MKKILLLFVLFLSANFLSANQPVSAPDAVVWTIYVDANGNCEYLDDGCSLGTIIVEDDVVWSQSGKC